MFDAKTFLEQYGIEHTDRDPKHGRTGWVQVHCPFCSGHEGWHGGFNIANGYYNCWRCGSHYLPKVVSALTGINYHDALKIVKQLSSGEVGERYKTRNYAKELTLPDTIPLNRRAKKYLTDRNYNPEKLEAIWGIKSTPHIGKYAFRIFIPITHNNKTISYTTRSITGAEPKYKACDDDKELYHHKFTLYGADKIINKDVCVVVEGPTDVWRLGIGAVGLFGINYSEPQVNLLSKFKRVFVFFDPESQAQIQAEKLYYQLTIRRVECQLLEDDGLNDPGDLSQTMADQLMKELL